MREAPLSRVAALYDIHGNLPALEAVLAEVADEDVDLIVVGGDVVPGPMPSDSLSALLDLSVPVEFLLGNGEGDILSLHRGEGLARVPEPFHDVMEWVANDLSPEAFREFAAWPLTVRRTIAGLGDVLFCHATPRDDNELFTRLTPEQRLRPIFAAANASVVVCGHTHMQFERSIGGVRVVNAGSVGMPFGDPGAYWVLLGPEVELRCTRYDLETAVARMGSTGCPQVAHFDVRNPRPESVMLELFEAAALQ